MSDSIYLWSSFSLFNSQAHSLKSRSLIANIHSFSVPWVWWNGDVQIVLQNDHCRLGPWINLGYLSSAWMGRVFFGTKDKHMYHQLEGHKSILHLLPHQLLCGLFPDSLSNHVPMLLLCRESYQVQREVWRNSRSHLWLLAHYHQRYNGQFLDVCHLKLLTHSCLTNLLNSNSILFFLFTLSSLQSFLDSIWMFQIAPVTLY